MAAIFFHLKLNWESQQLSGFIEHYAICLIALIWCRFSLQAFLSAPVDNFPWKSKWIERDQTNTALHWWIRLAIVYYHDSTCSLKVWGTHHIGSKAPSTQPVWWGPVVPCRLCEGHINVTGSQNWHASVGTGGNIIYIIWNDTNKAVWTFGRHAMCSTHNREI